MACLICVASLCKESFIDSRSKKRKLRAIRRLVAGVRTVTDRGESLRQPI